VGELLAQLLGGIAVVGLLSVGVGLTAPHWPARWLSRDSGPLHLTRWDTRQRYERLGVLWWKRRFPEGGDWAGGESKNQLPDLQDRQAITGYIVETRRAEWVHWLACLSWVPVLLFAEWWLVLVLAVLTLMVNAIALMIVRYNRLRLYQVLAELAETD
jgi:glycosyl-4,4'-diaponeurosporenoate acyltransferase